VPHIPEIALISATQDPVKFADDSVEGTRARGNRAKWYARLAVSTIIVSTAAIPVFLVLSTQWYGFFLGKVVPSVLAAIAAVTTGYVQVERPFERWQLYRRYQRLFEVERFTYANKGGAYSGGDAVSVFVQRLGELHIALHNEWSGIVPHSDDFTSASRHDQPK
jgi:Protein of unknown function (DUF4231)